MQTNYITNKLFLVESLPLFANLPSPQKRFVASKSDIIEAKKGDVIYKENDPPNYFYCVVNGRVKIYHPADKTKKRQELAIECIRKGDYFGSISSLTGQPHSVSAMALNDSIILRVNRKNFNHILRKVPKLGIFLSYSLPRRLSHKPVKEIFESTIITVYSLTDEKTSSSYVKDLADNIRKESGKKALIAKSSLMKNKKEIAPTLSALTEDSHYVLVNVSAPVNELNFEILKQSDICHVLSPSDKGSLLKASGLIKKLEASFSSYTKQAVFVILKEDEFYAKTSYESKANLISKEIFASLPADKTNYDKAIRRISRQISGIRIGLVLGSGAAMGLAHIGVVKELENERIPIDVISATSIGALIAALWAADIPVKEIEKLACSFKSKLRTLFLMDPTLPIRGLIKGRAVRAILKYYLGNKTFFDLKLPLKVVACDIKNRKEYIIDRGKLVDAIMASVAIPGVFEPVEHKGTQLVDGGIVNPLPVNVLLKSGIKRIIAVNTLPSPEDVIRIGQKRLNIYNIIVNSFQAMEFTIALNSCHQADVYLNPIAQITDWYEFYKAKLFIKVGQQHTRQALPEIERLVRK